VGGTMGLPGRCSRECGMSGGHPGGESLLPPATLPALWRAQGDPLKDQRSRRLVSLFGTVKVRAPRLPRVGVP